MVTEKASEARTAADSRTRGNKQRAGLSEGTLARLFDAKHSMDGMQAASLHRPSWCLACETLLLKSGRLHQTLSDLADRETVARAQPMIVGPRERAVDR